MKTILLFILFASNSFTQVNQEWVSRYNGPGNIYDGANSIAVDGAGNVYVTGYSQGSGSSFDYATIKYNSLGVEQWLARYNGPENKYDNAYSIAVDGAGNVYVTGLSRRSDINSDYATIKYNSLGVEQWVARYDGPGNSYDKANSIAVDGAGNVYVTGSSVGSGNNSDYATIKYDSLGVEQWVARYNGPGNDGDAAYSIAVDGAGNVYVTGDSRGSGSSSDYATIKYNSLGVEQWVARYNGPGNGYDYANSIAVDSAGNVYVAGYSQGSGNNYDYATIKYNSLGVEQWVARYNGPGNGTDYANSIAVDGAGNVYVTGDSRGSGDNEDYATIKYNSLGVEQWVARYNGPVNGYDRAYSIAVDGSGNVYVTGYSQGSEINSDYATLKYNSLGVEQWVARYNGPGNDNDYAYSIAVDGAGNVYVTGGGTGSGTDLDFVTIKYSQSIVTTTLTANVPAGSQVFEVASSNGFSIGDNIVINPGGATEETNTITGFGSMLIQTPLLFNHNSGEIVALQISTSVEDNYELIADEYSLSQNYPNPFNPSTKISWQSPVGGWQTLKVYDVLGNEVATLINEERPAGRYEVDFNAAGLSSGIYFYRLSVVPTARRNLVLEDGQAGDPSTSAGQGFIQTKKMIFLK